MSPGNWRRWDPLVVAGWTAYAAVLTLLAVRVL